MPALARFRSNAVKLKPTPAQTSNGASEWAIVCAITNELSKARFNANFDIPNRTEPYIESAAPEQAVLLSEIGKSWLKRSEAASCNLT